MIDISLFKTDLLQILYVDVDRDKINKLDKRVTHTHMLIFGKRIICLTLIIFEVLTCYLKTHCRIRFFNTLCK